MAYPEMPESSYQTMVEGLPEFLDKVTGGQLRIQFLTSPIKPTEYLTALRDGRIDLASIMSPFYRTEVPIINIGHLPGLFSSIEEYQKVTDEFLFDNFSKIFKEKYNMVYLAGGTLPGTMIFSKKPIRTAEDLKGVKVRTPQDETAQLMARYGATTMMPPWGEAFFALKQGALDAVIIGTTQGYAFNLYEVTKYATDWKIGYLTPWAIVVNQKAWTSLPTDLQTTLASGFKKIQTEGFVNAAYETKKSLDLLKEKGVRIITPSKAEIAKIQDPKIVNEIYKGWVDLNKKQGINSETILAQVLEAKSTGGGGDPCYYPTCRCPDGACKTECCPRR
jgi:TRAP-type C4-dicarboxylate transport system substrate-binding protein